ncbi:hypothetical protein PAECIP112173_00353 [Paenibacillus sp. JJ-100]|uniref:hypothetical protein n=1 Tax=Paenibacillus sp. JJ-100 TaxID=2974896 RepID=UPI0022FF5020|nr:hypothetical protein [Paenibacillus sp. JJ-100]CAI6023702.1 hypothetical protein PAECIP112173_00353 [Paenibacillus sp. JJ-100]
MPQKSGFFDTTADDPRDYPAREFAEYFSRFVGNGIFSGGTKLKVSATGTNSNVKIETGFGWINGYLYSVYDEPLTLTVQPATNADRIDRVILRLDTSTPVRAIRALILQGNPAATPTVPAITRSGDVYDLSLAQILVKANTSVVLPENITDERLNSAVCGIVTGLIQQADTTSIFNQFQAWLNTKTAEYRKQWEDFLKTVQDEGFATTQYVDDAKQAAIDASVPRSGGVNMTGRLINGRWGTFSSSSNGSTLYGSNCFLDGDTFKFENTHANLGARGIYMRYTGGAGPEVYMFDTGARVTTAGEAFTPDLRRILNFTDVVVPDDAPTTNLIWNSTGLFGTEGWTNGGGVSWLTSSSPDVTGLFYTNAEIPSNQYAVLDSAPISVYPGANYELQALFHTSLVTTGIVAIEVKNVANDATLLSLAADNNKWWHRKRVSLTGPAGVNQIKLRLVATNVPANATKGIARIKFNLRNVPTKDVPYDFTGDMANMANQLMQVKQSGVDAKNGIVGAINANGGSASTSDTWAVLAQKVQSVSGFKPGTYDLYTYDSVVGGTSSTGWAKIRSFQPSIGGTYRVSHRFSIDSSITGASGYCRWYVNDVPVGVERYVNNNGSTTFEEDITLKQGDVLQLFMRSTNSQNNVYGGNVRFKIAFGVTVS